MAGHTNKLILEKSPYLLQHAHNPVDWHPWGDEAFAEARRRDIPVFLSIGYSTCHWCHVMERESFEDEDVASVLNANFVCIKVDREERPDIDHLYMNACTAMTGQGGWPLSCFLTPDKKPFFAGSYLPKDDRYGMRGFMTILETISNLWRNERPRLLAASADIMAHIAAPPQTAHENIRENASSAAFKQLAASFDRKNGGFGQAPKFPSAHNLLFLIRYHILYKEPLAAQMVAETLRAMQRGGIWDHIGGGFCRYATDQQWLVPHFEKMMYDNAMLTIAFCEAGAAIDESFFNTVRRILEYAFQEMHDDDGGFYTAQDADSEGEEGRYYVFTPSEIQLVLGAEDGKRFCSLFNITPQGNFEGKSIPNLLYSNPFADDAAFAQKCFPDLLQFRNKRVPPLKDDKKLASVNGLMLAALATAGRLMRDEKCIAAAEKTGVFLLKNMFHNGRLNASFRQGDLRHPATSDDYAYVLWGLFELYQTTLVPCWLSQAIRLADSMLELFQDGQGALYLSGRDVHDLPVRTKNTHDGALPSGNAVAAQVLVRIADITHREQYRTAAKAIAESLSGVISAYPTAFTGLLCADLYNRHGGIQAVLASGAGISDLQQAVSGFNPFLTVALCGEGFREMDILAPHVKDYRPLDGSATAYICSPRGCQSPIADPAVAARETAPAP